MEQAIGVIGGVGPQAGLDLVEKIFENTIAKGDQGHIDLYLTSLASQIADRTSYLLEGGESPVSGLITSFNKLATLGSTVIAIPCNTAHAPLIYDELAAWAKKAWPQVRLLHMIEEAMRVLAKQFASKATIGLLATKGTHRTDIYGEHFKDAINLSLLQPDKDTQEAVHQAIYNQGWGIKAHYPPTEEAKQVITLAAQKLVEGGAQAIILGCTELPLAFVGDEVGVPLIDSTRLLARAAIREVAPQKLKSQ